MPHHQRIDVPCRKVASGRRLQRLSQKQIRNSVHARAGDVSQALAALVADGCVIRTAAGYQPAAL